MIAYRHINRLGIVTAVALLGGCATASLTDGTTLSSSTALKPSDGIMTKSRQHIDKLALLAAKSVRIMPTTFTGKAVEAGLGRDQLALVGNAVDRALCANLSRRMTIAADRQPSDLVVQVVVTDVGKTDKLSAGASVVTSLGTTVAGAVTGVPLPSLRLPFGMGSLAAEAEVKTPAGSQVAALVCARGPDSFLTKPRVAEEGDAHTLASELADDLAKLIVTGTDPIANPMPLPPSQQGDSEYFGAEAEQPACRRFGRHPGLGNTLGAAIGLPPATTDSERRRP